MKKTKAIKWLFVIVLVLAAGVMTMVPVLQRVLQRHAYRTAMDPHADFHDRCRAVETLTDPVMIADVAKNAEDLEINLLAFDKLTDPAIRDDVVKNARSPAMRRDAKIKTMTDQTELADIANNDPDWGARHMAVQTMTDQAVLADVAKNDLHPEVRAAAKKRLAERKLQDKKMQEK